MFCLFPQFEHCQNKCHWNLFLQLPRQLRKTQAFLELPRQIPVTNRSQWAELKIQLGRQFDIPALD